LAHKLFANVDPGYELKPYVAPTNANRSRVETAQDIYRHYLMQIGPVLGANPQQYADYVNRWLQSNRPNFEALVGNDLNASQQALQGLARTFTADFPAANSTNLVNRAFAEAELKKMDVLGISQAGANPVTSPSTNSATPRLTREQIVQTLQGNQPVVAPTALTAAQQQQLTAHQNTLSGVISGNGGIRQVINSALPQDRAALIQNLSLSNGIVLGSEYLTQGEALFGARSDPNNPASEFRVALAMAAGNDAGKVQAAKNQLLQAQQTLGAHSARLDALSSSIQRDMQGHPKDSAAYAALNSLNNQVVQLKQRVDDLTADITRLLRAEEKFLPQPQTLPTPPGNQPGLQPLPQ
jgi:hypothetical protein